MDKRLTEHNADVRNHKDTSSFVNHIDSHGHLPDWKKTEVLWSGQGKTKRKLVESAVIETLPNINSKRGDLTLAPMIALMLWSDHVSHELNIDILNFGSHSAVYRRHCFD